MKIMMPGSKGLNPHELAHIIHCNMARPFFPQTEKEMDFL